MQAKRGLCFPKEKEHNDFHYSSFNLSSSILRARKKSTLSTCILVRLNGVIPFAMKGILF